MEKSRRQENRNAIFISFSPTTALEYFLYFEMAAIRLFSLPTFFPNSETYCQTSGPTGIVSPTPRPEDRTAHQGRWHSHSIRPTRRVSHHARPVPPCSWRRREPPGKKRRCSSSLLRPALSLTYVSLLLNCWSLSTEVRIVQNAKDKWHPSAMFSHDSFP